MRCLIYWEPVAMSRTEKRLGYRMQNTRCIVGDGFAYNSVYFAKEELRDCAKHLRRQGWKTKGNMRQGRYETFRGKKRRLLYTETVDI